MFPIIIPTENIYKLLQYIIIELPCDAIGFYSDQLGM